MKYLKDFLFSSVLGFASLILINLFGSYIGVNLTLSYINIVTSVLLGTPGVTGLIIFENLLL